MRTLTAAEVDQVTGGALNLGTGALAAGISGLASGGVYAYNSTQAGNFSWGNFVLVTANNAASGFLVGSGATLITTGARSTKAVGAGIAGFGAIGGAANNASISNSSESGGSD
jgi:hypothetical protein